LDSFYAATTFLISFATTSMGIDEWPSNISVVESQTAGNASVEPIKAIVVAFYIGRLISILSVVLGIPGNVALIVIVLSILERATTSV
jgi:hypothetical protein